LRVVLYAGGHVTVQREGISAGSPELTRSCAIAGIALVMLLLVGALAGSSGPWGLRNWLVVLHGVNLGADAAAIGALQGIRVVDIAVLALGGVTFLGMRPALGAADRYWLGSAVALPFAGIVLLAATGLAGRSALMAGGLVLSWRLTKRDRYRMLGWTGVTANGLLLLADLATGDSPGPAQADVIAAGYVLLLLWLAWLVYRMLKPLPGRPVPVGRYRVGPGGGCRGGGSDTTELFDLPLQSKVEGDMGTFVGVADASTRFTVGERSVTLMRFLEAYDEGVQFEIQVEESGRLARMAIDIGGVGEGTS
jgi:hypothetical protein